MQKDNIVHQPDVYPLAEFLAAKFGCDSILNIQESLDATKEVLKKSVVIFSDVNESKQSPSQLLHNLKNILDDSPVCIVTSSNKEISITEFDNLLNSYNFNVSFLGYTANNDRDLKKQTILAVIEENKAKLNFRETFERAPKNFKVTAIIPTYNESDIIESTIKYHVDQGIDVYVLDNWSTDDTVQKVEKFVGKGVVGVEKFPKEGPSEYYLYGKILSRIIEISQGLNSDWFITNDADVLKLSPWRDVTLKDAIYAVDKTGYNAIDHTSLTFRPIDESYSSKVEPEKHFKFFEFRKNPGQFIQIRSWKNTQNETSLGNGGHEVQFEGRRVYPYKFFYKHYPILSQKQGVRKILQERKARYDPAELAKGWHTHYKQFTKSDDFVWSEKELIEFDETIYKDFLVELISGVGIRR